MPREKEDLIRLFHMYTSGREAIDSAKGLTRRELETDRQLQHTLIHCLQIIGEAANKTSAEFKKAWPKVPWRELVRLRHHLVHVYFQVDLDVVWKSVTEDLPQMLPEIESMLVAKGMIQRESGL